jgi:acyl-CoA synthetase (NDP forming)/RimJ/RimL family protein N-acetyltransferase
VKPETAVTASIPGGVDALLRDGRVATVRPVVPADREALERLHADASTRSRYLRFFSSDEEMPRRYAEHLATPGDDHFAVLATAAGDVIGVASAELCPEASADRPAEHPAEHQDATTAEVAVMVAEAWHGTGTGTLLLEHLAAAAVDRGIRRFTAEVLTQNGPMMDVFLHAGYTTRYGHPEDAVRAVELDLARTPALAERIAERERAADAASIAAVLEPRAVLVVGAGRRPGGVGREVLANLQAARFTGELAVVNPKVDFGDRIGGVSAFTSAGLVPWPVDLAVVTVPAAHVPDAIRDCGEAGVRAVVVVSSGFADAGDAAAQRELVALAHRYGMRLVGPNCLGVVNTDPAIRLNATFAALDGFEVGTEGVGLASQSGALGIAVLAAASRRGLPVADFVSLGNKADVSGNDLLLYWERNPRIAVAALYLESIGNPRRFRRIAARVSTQTPIVTLTSGRSAAGARAGASHTAATATPAAVSAALFRDAGVVATDTSEEFLDVIQLLASQNVPAGTRLAVVGNAGGPGALAADAAVAAGGSVPAFGPDLTAALRRSVTGAASVVNPVDLGAAAGADAYGRAIHLILGSGEVDAVVAIHAATRAQPVDDVLRAVESAAEHGGAGGRQLPVAGVLLGVEPRHVDVLPWYGFAEAAAHALVRAGELGLWRASAREPADAAPSMLDVDAAAVRSHLDVAPRDAAGFLAPQAAFGLLTILGITVCRPQEVLGPDEAAAVADRWGVPVAVKTAAPGVVHKSDGGGVALGLDGHDAVVAAARRIVAATGSGHLVVQPMAPDGLELIAGLSAPPAGPAVVMAGAGGVHEAVMADHVLRTLPLAPDAAAAMLDELRCAPLLHGHRGSPPLDHHAAAAVLDRLALLARIAPDVTELDVNPLVVTEHGATAVDVKVRLAAPAAAGADPVADRAARALDR